MWHIQSHDTRLTNPCTNPNADTWHWIVLSINSKDFLFALAANQQPANCEADLQATRSRWLRILLNTCIYWIIQMDFKVKYHSLNCRLQFPSYWNPVNQRANYFNCCELGKWRKLSQIKLSATIKIGHTVLLQRESWWQMCHSTSNWVSSVWIGSWLSWTQANRVSMPFIIIGSRKMCIYLICK